MKVTSFVPDPVSCKPHINFILFGKHLSKVKTGILILNFIYLNIFKIAFIILYWSTCGQYKNY